MQIYASAPTNAPQTEQALIASFFGTQADGTFLDIGAFDGLCYSNTRELYERGWSGTLVEPDSGMFARLQATYANAPRATLINAALMPARGPVTFYQHTSPERIGWHSADPRWVATWPVGTSHAITVAGITFADLTLPPALDLLSIDAEGMDYEILHSMPVDLRPRLIVLEVDKQGVREAVEPEMGRRGYEFLWGTYLNSAYRRREV